MKEQIKNQLILWAEEYNHPKYFEEDPIIFPTKFKQLLDPNFAKQEGLNQSCLQDIEVAAIFASHFAWGRRNMIVRDCNRLFDEMKWQPYNYVMEGNWKDENSSIHRTIKWCDVAEICRRLQNFYKKDNSLECLTVNDIRTLIFGQKEDKKAPNKKINMMRRWLVRDDDKVDLGVWKNTDKQSLIIPLDVHVYNIASILELTKRKQKDIVTAQEITDCFTDIFEGDPCKGDFALFGYGVNNPKTKEIEL